MAADTLHIPVPVHRLRHHEGFRALTSRERGAYLLSLCLLTHPDPASPLHGCLCTGELPMTLEEWGREVGESNRAPATRLWKRLFDLNLLEWHHHDGRPYPRLTVCADPSTTPIATPPTTPDAPPASTATPDAPVPSPAPDAASLPEAAAPVPQGPGPRAPLTRAHATDYAQACVRLSGHRTSITDWLDRIRSLGHTPEGVAALEAVLADVARALGSPDPPKDPQALLEARLDEACHAHP